MALGNKARVDELRREIARIQEENRTRGHRIRTHAEREANDRRNSRLREIQAELQAMKKKELPK